MYTQLYGFKYSYLTPIMYTKLHGFKYSYLTPIMYTQLYGFKYSYLTPIMYTKLHGFKYSYLTPIMYNTQLHGFNYSYLTLIMHTQLHGFEYSYLIWRSIRPIDGILTGTTTPRHCQKKPCEVEFSLPFFLCPGYDTIASDSKAPVLDLWGIWNTPSLLLLPDPL